MGTNTARFGTVGRVINACLPLSLPARVLQALVTLFTSSRFLVEGESMAPALAGGQSVLASRPRLTWDRLRRGDVVVLRHPVWDDQIDIKRIIGLPGEEVRLKDGRVYLDGALLNEAYLDGPPSQRKEYDREWWTGSDEYFVMGDNRGDSGDSRAFGPVHRQRILGRVWLRCWPPRAWGPVR
ncbi:MAG: signal peptidase I [Chloroflexota bacterium]